MHTEDDTADWLGIPTPLETCKQHILLLENEVAELSLQLRDARENIYKLVRLHAAALHDRDEAVVRVRSKAAEATQHRNRVIELEASCEFLRRTNEDLRRQIPVGVRRR
ncbi:hypothetical protein PPC_3451 [Pseudomonas protegens Cab57]|uniref:hypothetical protein n=1 Tax=Pseudomonas protegens TaxID=380021 RepID=UPI0004425C89|nr:hypothetical protein [Pseudomonas protegens]BAO62798.1 hypothetical protein PPC_3451 [Pseudomonas protegens Cab57]